MLFHDSLFHDVQPLPGDALQLFDAVLLPSCGFQFLFVLKKKSRLTPIGGGFPLVARGEVTLGIAQTADFAPPIGPPLGVDLIGPLPESVQERILLSAAVVSSAREPQAARALVVFLASPAAAPAIAAHGMER